jgi:hypothetical protein
VLEEQPLLLDQSSRRVLLMHDLYGISVRQIGAITGKPPREIAVDLIRARRIIGPRKSPEFRIGDRVRVKAPDVIDDLADVLSSPGGAAESIARHYILTQDMGSRDIVLTNSNLSKEEMPGRLPRIQIRAATMGGEKKRKPEASDLRALLAQ